jgi:hypothetical protein
MRTALGAICLKAGAPIRMAEMEAAMIGGLKAIRGGLNPADVERVRKHREFYQYDLHYSDGTSAV